MSKTLKEAPIEVGVNTPLTTVTPVHIEFFMRLMTEHKIDFLELGNLKLSKSQHEYPQPPKDTSRAKQDIDEEALFYSAQ
jgi:hypothetical protein